MVSALYNMYKLCAAMCYPAGECVSRPEAGCVWPCWQVLIASHKAWLKLQRCKDRFEPLLCLDALKGCSNAPVGAAASPVKAGAAAYNGSTAAGSGTRCRTDAY